MRKHSEFLSKLETARRAVKPKSDPRQAQAASAPTPAKVSRTARAPAAPAPVEPAAPAPVNTAQPVARPSDAAFQNQSTKPIPSVDTQDFEIDDIALQIGSVVEQLSEDETTSQDEMHTPSIQEPHPSLFEDDDGSVKLYSPDEEDDEEEETSPRPKFDFDDLKFGANFDSDD